MLESDVKGKNGLVRVGALALWVLAWDVVLIFTDTLILFFAAGLSWPDALHRSVEDIRGGGGCDNILHFFLRALSFLRKKGKDVHTWPEGGYCSSSFYDIYSWFICL